MEDKIPCRENKMINQSITLLRRAIWANEENKPPRVYASCQKTFGPSLQPALASAKQKHIYHNPAKTPIFLFSTAVYRSVVTGCFLIHVHLFENIKKTDLYDIF